MSVANVLRLDDYRDRRQHRLTLARAFASGAASSRSLVDHLARVAETVGADRAAAVWVDESGPSLVHPYLVLDLLCDRPRRGFSPDPLNRAWDAGIPGSHDSPVDRDAIGPSTIAVALGSDGARGWFLVADSVTRRPPLDSERRDRLMFLAGECSSIVLHRDLDAEPGTEEARFAGWGYLSDIDGYENDEARASVVTRRFVVGRLVRMFLDDELVLADERRAELARRARREIGGSRESSDTCHLEVVLDAFEAGEVEALAASMVNFGEAAEHDGHMGGAVEAYRACFELASAVGDPQVAVEAARRLGRLMRRSASWEDADAWYQRALTISRAAGLTALVARSISGLGLIKREMGNLPAARERFESALEAAEASEDREALASVHHDLMGLEAQAGDAHKALRHGWRAVNTYVTEVSRTRCMAGIAGVLLELGDLEPAEDAYMVVARRSDEIYYQIYAHDGLAYVAALRGETDLFDTRIALLDRLDWERGPRSAKAEILFYRGLGHAALGRAQEARAWLTRAIEFAAEHKFSRVLFKAEEALALISVEGVAQPVQDRRAAPPEVRSGLRAMREELVGAGL